MARRTDPGTPGRSVVSGGTGSSTWRDNTATYVGSGEGRLTRQQLVEDAGQAVLVGPGIDLAVASGLLGTHVGGGPHAQAGLGQPVAGRDARGARDAEVRDQRMALGEQDVLRLHVAMDQPLRVGVVERFPGLPHQAQRLGQGSGPSRVSRWRRVSPSTYGMT